MKSYDTEEEALRNAATDHDYFVEDFEGKNCKGACNPGNECAGWNTEDRRCQCGNRRVSWATEQDNHGKWYAYAEAY